MQSTLDSTLSWWIAGPILGLVIVSFLTLANKRFGVVGGVTDLVQGSAEGRGLRSAAQLGAGRLLAVAVAAGIVMGVGLQPRLARAVEHVKGRATAHASADPAAEVL